MPLAQVKPTRMELSNLKKKSKVAVRGHKLMKDKRDEMVRRFIVCVKLNKDLRERVEKQLSVVMAQFVLAKASMTSEELEEALVFPAAPLSVKCSKKSILSVEVPDISADVNEQRVLRTYGLATTSSELDEAVRAFTELVPLLIELAEAEKTSARLADEIEKTRRRVNALEFVMIPQFEEQIRRISMKLDENELGNLTRLMKTKEMLNARE